MSSRVFRSKVDRWLVFVVASSSLLTIAVAVVGIVDEGFMFVPIALLIVVVGVGLPAWLFLATTYVLSATELLIRCGPFRCRVPLREIKNIRASRDLLSSPALSLDRLRIEYGRNRSILISPLEREEFLREIESRIKTSRDNCEEVVT